MSVELGFFILGVQNVELARAFYGNLFGWTFDEHAKVSNTRVGLGLCQSGAADASDACFDVRDLAESLLRLETLGGMVIERNATRWGSVVRCSDDQGTQFSMRQIEPGARVIQ